MNPNAKEAMQVVSEKEDSIASMVDLDNQNCLFSKGIYGKCILARYHYF